MTTTRTPAETMLAAADHLDAIPDAELERCLGVDGQPCGATPTLSRDAIHILSALLRQMAEQYAGPAYQWPMRPDKPLNLAEEVLASKEADR